MHKTILRGGVLLAAVLFLNTSCKSQTISGQVTVPCQTNVNFPLTQAPITDLFLNLTCNVSSTTISGTAQPGTEIVVTITQDAVGGRTFVWPVNFLNTPTLATQANASNVATFQFCGTQGAGAGLACPANSWQNTDIGPAGGLTFPIGQTPNTNSIYAGDPKYGVVGDGKFSNATTIVNTSPTITTGSSDPVFTVADIGKQIFCNADPSGLSGATVLVKSIITGFTSAHVVTASNNATASQANALCLWGTPSQDAGLTSFWNDVKTSPTQTCGILPSGIIMVDSSQFTDASSTRQFGDCLYSAGFTTVVPTPSFNFATCPTATSGCFWHHPNQIAIQQPNSDDIRNIEVWGLGNNLNAFSTTNSIFSFQRATVINVWAWGWGATSSSLTGMQFAGPDQVFEAVVYQVKTACATTNTGGNQTVAFVASFCGGSSGNNLNVSAGSYFVSSQSQFGPNNAGTGVLAAGTLDSTGDVFLGSSSGFTVTVSGTFNIRGGQITAASTGTGLLIQAGGKVNSETTNINASGGSAVAILRQTTGVYNDLLGNTITAGTFPTIVPTCTFTSGGGTSPSCALQTGSTNEKGVIIASTGTGAPGSQGTITLTFAGTVSGTTGTAPACTYTLDNSGTTWGAEAIVFVSTQSTTAPLIAWTNINAVALAALATSSPYRIDYTCIPR